MAAGRPAGAGAITFATSAMQLLDHGYEPLPLRPGQKVPAVSRWTQIPIDEDRVGAWCRTHSDCGVGLRTGTLVGLDIDLPDPDAAHAVCAAATARFGETLLRVGNWPKRLLLYRCDRPFAKITVPGIELLGAGQQFVAFGTHPDTGRAYTWPFGDTPLDVPLEDLPLVREENLRAFLGEYAAASGPPSSRRARTAPPQSSDPVRDPSGRVVDGRDAWLSQIAFHVFRDALDRGDKRPDVERLADLIWERFAATTDLTRPRKNGGTTYARADALRKIRDKQRLHRDGRLPARKSAAVEAGYGVPTATVEEARQTLDGALKEAMNRFLSWHRSDGAESALQIGIRATVGLGKSSAARRHLLELRQGLTAGGLPDRIVVFTPSHALAEEAAEEWRQEGVTAAVLRGYDRHHPVRKTPMCRDREAVSAALSNGLDIQESVCGEAGGQRCRFFDGCFKQQNRREIAAAEVILAPYDALYTGFAIDPASIGIVVVDEGCWARAVEEHRGTFVETLSMEPVAGIGGFAARVAASSLSADLVAIRGDVASALDSCPPGPVLRDTLIAAGLTAETLERAARLEERRIRDPGFVPGMEREVRCRALAIVGANVQARRLSRLWRALADCLGGAEGRLRILDRAGAREILLLERKRVHPNFRDKPVLHLDATLRPDLARLTFPCLEVTEIEADGPNMTLRLITGGFGKTALCQDTRATAEENARRARKLAEVVQYVRWQAVKVHPGRILVVTYKDCESAFDGIPGVETAHFNAIAGLDCYRDVDLLIVVGRPLPNPSDLNTQVAGQFGKLGDGAYRWVDKGIRMRSGAVRAVRTIGHKDPRAELLRAAITDDELIQAIGRGRGVNRRPDNPIEVQVLADVALPLPHDEVTAWDLVAPDLLQKMLLAGPAVDSPADAAIVHPQLFGNAEQAKKVFARGVFKGQIHIGDTYRGMSLKSAAYRRPGRGRAWQRCWWIGGSAREAQARLLSALGQLAEFVVDE